MIHYQMIASCFSLRPQRKFMKEIGAEKERNIYQLACYFLLVNITDKNNYFNDIYHSIRILEFLLINHIIFIDNKTD